MDALQKEKEHVIVRHLHRYIFLSGHFFLLPKQDLKCHEKSSKIVVMVDFSAPIITETNPTKQLGNKRIQEKLYCIQIAHICTIKLKRALPATIKVKNSGRYQGGNSGVGGGV